MADRKASVSSSRANTNAAAASSSGDPPTTVSATSSAAMSNIRSASPYGTRSRNRGARVNYAEDKDNDMDYEFTTPYNHTPSNTKANGSLEGASSGTSRRQSAIVGLGKDTKDGKDVAPAVPPVSTNTTAGKKRKGGQIVVPTMTKDPSLSNMLSFDRPHLKDGKLVAEDGTALEVHDHIYLVCEPPGEPYYLARIMEFLHANNDPTQPIDAIRVNWYYRPKDIQRKVTDTRVLFASMHSDTCPLSSIRGKCYIKHRSEIENINEYRKYRDSFYFERMFDRYIQRYYDVIPSTAVRNVPEAIRKVLVERWRYLLVEPQRGKELCSQMKECKRCVGYCASADSVHCAVCGATYHMNCVRPPLLKKPSRGFAWACGPCNRAQERKLEARNTPALTSGTNTSADVEEDVYDDEEDDLSAAAGMGTETPSEMAMDVDKQQEPTPEQVGFARMWQMRYLGQHCRVEDALDYDDRIYPRAASRLGTRHQANVAAWPGRPVEYIKPPEKKKYTKGGSKSKQLSEAEAAAKEKRPKWVMEEPPGYIERGKDDGTTSTLIFKIPEESDQEKAQPKRQEYLNAVDGYMRGMQEHAKKISVHHYTTNYMDKALQILCESGFQEKKALEKLSKVQAVRDVKEVRLKPDELKRFEEGVAKYGSELHAVTKHVKTRKEAEIVRFYYIWKKSPQGREIWGNYDGRKGKKEAKLRDKDATTSSKLVDDVADDEDDSAFDVEKASNKKRGFECKFCSTRHSRQWRRAPGVAPGTLIPAEKGSSSKRKNADDRLLVSALCRRCAELWRRYGIRWEDPDEVQKKMSQGGGRAWKRRIDEELLKELTAAQEDAQAEAMALAASTAASASSVTPQPSTSGTVTPDEKKDQPPKKKAKTETNGYGRKAKEKGKEKAKDKEKEKGKEKEKEKKEKERERKEKNDDKDNEKQDEGGEMLKEREKTPEKAKEPPPPPPEPPRPKIAECGVCRKDEEVGKQHAICRDCKMTVHKKCYGVGEMRSANKWVCEMCANDKNPSVSTNYECVLCPEYQDPDAEPEKNNPYHKSSYKKKAVQDKAYKESPEVDGRKVKESDKHKPQQPRDPLKKTSGNNWAHVTCAIWTPEIKFSDPKTMKVVEGIATIPKSRFEQECKICRGNNGHCVQCTACNANVHINCANKSRWPMGFDIQPVKGRRDTVNANIVKLGNETGNMTACIWCPEHETNFHPINELSEDGMTALELYLTTYKQADLTLTGTVRKANLVSISTKSTQSNRNGGKEGSDSPTTVSIKTEGAEEIVGLEGLIQDHVGGDGPKRCVQCQVDVSPLWWKVPPPPTTNGAASPGALTNGNTPKSHHTLGLMCHRCHTNDKEKPITPLLGKANGHRPDSKFTPLPPLHVFLAQQHQHTAVPRQPSAQPIQQVPPPPPPMVPSVRTVAVPHSSVVNPISPQQRLPPSQMVPMNQQPMALVPPPHAMMHQLPHQPPAPHPLMHVPLPHPPPPPPQHMSPRAPHHSHSPHIHHGSPPTHVRHVVHMPQQPPPHMPPLQTHNIMSPRHPTHPHASSPPHMVSMSGPPLGLHRRNSASQTPAMSQLPVHQQPHPPQQQQQQQQQQEELPRRVLSGASGSPALANLLS